VEREVHSRCTSFCAPPQDKPTLSSDSSEPVAIEFTPAESHDVAVACGPPMQRRAETKAIGQGDKGDDESSDSFEPSQLVTTGVPLPCPCRSTRASRRFFLALPPAYGWIIPVRGAANVCGATWRAAGDGGSSIRFEASAFESVSSNWSPVSRHNVSRTVDPSKLDRLSQVFGCGDRTSRRRGPRGERPAGRRPALATFR
jgi:hypothetical protein